MPTSHDPWTRRVAAMAVVLATVLAVVGPGGARADAAPLPRIGATCSTRQVGHQYVVGSDRVRCERDGRSTRWSLVPRPRIMLFGDSLAQESADYFGFFGGIGGADMRVAVHGGTAICDWFDEMVHAVHDFRPDAVVLAFTGNALDAVHARRERAWRWPVQALVDKYTHDVVAATWILSHTTRSITWVGAPVGPTPNATTDALNALYQSHPGVVVARALRRRRCAHRAQRHACDHAAVLVLRAVHRTGDRWRAAQHGALAGRAAPVPELNRSGGGCAWRRARPTRRARCGTR